VYNDHIVEEISMHTEKLFSYGTLQYEAVQLSTFKRKLQGTPDVLTQFRIAYIQITDPDVVAMSGDSVHKTLLYTGDVNDQVPGVVFLISPDELQQADVYESADYKRVKVKLRSGAAAWVYVSPDQVID
jgi:gamma-glutamylcyclotransferase (GGCT)/AIG2-like uncharacterized protein YtfP